MADGREGKFFGLIKSEGTEKVFGDFQDTFFKKGLEREAATLPQIKKALVSACKISGKIEMSHHVFLWWLFDMQKAKKMPRARRGDDYFNCSKITLNSLVFLIASNSFSASHTSRTL